MNVKKEAKKDAFEFARAQMAYGQGAGTRRKLIKAAVDHKADTIPGYLAAFYQASLEQDMAKHAAKAKQIRQTKDISQATAKNVKGLATGNYRSVNAGVLTIAGIAYVLHKTEADLYLLDKAKEGYSRLKQKYQKRKLKLVQNSN